MYKALIVLAIAGVASAGVLDYHVGATNEQTVRGYGGLSSISHQSKNVNSAYSTASSYKTKLTNNAVPVAYAQPAYAHAVAAPAYAPAVQYASPVAHAIAPAYAHQAYAAPAYARAVASPVAKLGVAYSPVVPGVATYSFDSPLVHFGY